MPTHLNIEQPVALVNYLRGTNRIGAGEVPRMTVLPGGVSNRTVLVERAEGSAMVLKQALAKLRVEADWFCDPARIHREALGLTWLSRLAPHGTIPPLLFEDREHHLLAMAAVPQPHENWKTRLLAGHVEPDCLSQFGQLLGRIHEQSIAQPETLGQAFADRSFFESLRLEPYYRYAAHNVPEAHGFLHLLIEETQATRLALVHGDYSPKNILIHQGRLQLLDHEVIHWGDPAFDLGFSLTHLLSKALHLPVHRDQLLQAAKDYWRAYRTTAPSLACQPGLESRAVRHTLACLLARVDGRSPLEYLTPTERGFQRRWVLELMRQAPGNLAGLFEAYGQALNR